MIHHHKTITKSIITLCMVIAGTMLLNGCIPKNSLIDRAIRSSSSERGYSRPGYGTEFSCFDTLQQYKLTHKKVLPLVKKCMKSPWGKWRKRFPKRKPPSRGQILSKLGKPFSKTKSFFSYNFTNPEGTKMKVLFDFETGPDSISYCDRATLSVRDIREEVEQMDQYYRDINKVPPHDCQ